MRTEQGYRWFYEEDPTVKLRFACPKCKAGPGEPCRSIIHGGPLRTRVYVTHRKRMIAAILGHPSTGREAVPVRPAARGRPQVGRVDSAARGLR